MIKNKTIKIFKFNDCEEIRIENWHRARRTIVLSEQYLLMSVTTCTRVQCDKCLDRLNSVVQFYRKGLTRLVWLDLHIELLNNDPNQINLLWDQNGSPEAWLLIKKEKQTDWRQCLYDLGIRFTYWDPRFRGGMHEYIPDEV